ncbi:hypothetical protein [Muricoccus radiodurans]|uniref:hypothetical protein n=1 Tax=Muricoccus radiodurans TaxID=2231721 RepID=UPI003CF4660D
MSVQNLGLIAAVLTVAAFLAFEADICVHEGTATPQGKVIEFDEPLLLDRLLAISLLVFSVRWFQDQRREIRRRPDGIVAARRRRTHTRATPRARR